MRRNGASLSSIHGGSMPVPQSRFTRGPRRAMVWARQIINVSIAAAGVSITNLLSDLETEAGMLFQGVTITRTLGHLTFRNATLDSVNRAINCFVVTLVKPTAFTTYAPSTSEYLKGITFYDNVSSPALQWEMSAGVFLPVPVELVDIDIKSQRKVARVEEEYQLVIQNVTGDSVNVDGFFNTLVKLP